jgi:predicted  nucleic acid-binding Zn-ribbon protein
MEAEAKVSMDVIEQLIRLQEVDRKRDRLQKRLDQVPMKLKEHTDGIARLETARAEHEHALKAARAEADRAELEVNTREERREKIKGQMNAPKLTNREYEALQVELAGVLADINSFSDKALKALERASEAESNLAKLQQELAAARATYETAKAELEGSLADVRQELAQRDAERAAVVALAAGDPLQIYERVRRKHKDALAIVDGTIDRVAGRIGSDLHCASCHMAVTANDAVHVLGRKKVVQCRSCVRILYVP